ncbi:MAG: hypothetical protein KDA61_23275 [Planctomycetales bacterium]|nr:hypothetical protein [Planctomycetales bacterium]
MTKTFRSREAAGRLLGERLSELPLHAPIVVGIPRGGLVTACEVAKCLDADLDVALTERIRSPLYPAVGIGAVGEDDETYLCRPIHEFGDVTEDYIDVESRLERARLRDLREIYRPWRHHGSLESRSVIVIDEGVATGSTMQAAVRMLRRRRPLEILAAAPVASIDVACWLREKCDRFLCLELTDSNVSIGDCYDAFRAVTHGEASQILADYVERRIARRPASLVKKASLA